MANIVYPSIVIIMALMILYVCCCVFCKDDGCCSSKDAKTKNGDFIEGRVEKEEVERIRAIGKKLEGF